ncbi:hypothetical protein BDZ89DRAFT_1061450 [Hymenopellis radicata]|nr:hypothetical protein BDZ89DRAFT_1061450 [Hymenopellis radicata]
MHASAVSAIISFLTDSLIPFFHPLILHAVRLHLRLTLPSYFSSSNELSLSPGSRPPRLLLSTPVPFAQWMVFLGNQPIRIVVSSSEVKAVFDSRTATLWRKDGEDDLCGDNVRAIARNDSISMKKYVPPMRTPSCIPHIRVAIPVEDDSSSSSDSDADSDDGYTSEESMTSVSSTRSVYSETKPSSICSSAAASISRATPATTYLYQGGKTSVVTGGVMLSSQPTVKSAVRSPMRPSPSAINNPSSTWRKSPSPFAKTRRTPVGPDSGNWRKRD